VDFDIGIIDRREGKIYRETVRYQVMRLMRINKMIRKRSIPLRVCPVCENSNPHIGQVSPSEGICMAQEGHSFLGI
jgi:hypothetical protein